jgi:hypothetical protein
MRLATVGSATQPPSDKAFMALKLGGLHQKTHTFDPLPLICVEPEGQLHARGQGLCVSEPDAVHRLALMLELEGQVFFADKAL